jgi:hypothetical protein
MILRSLSSIAAAVYFVLAHTHAQATSLATFVSGTGTDSGACPIAAPCKTFQFAHDQTTAGGTIIVLTGGSFGGVNITKSISILAEGVEALINSKAASCGSAVCIAAGAAVVYLRGLTIDLNNAKSSSGITAGDGKALHVQNCVIRRVAEWGIHFRASTPSSALFVSNSTVMDSSYRGLEITDTSPGSYIATVDRVHVENSDSLNVFLDAIGGNNKATVRNSVISGNGDGIAVQTNTGSSTTVMIDHTVMVNARHNSVGLSANGTSAVVRVGDSTISANGFGLTNTSGAQMLSYKTNDVIGNGTNGAPSGTLTMK